LGASIVIGLVLLLGFIGPILPYKEVRYWTCPVSGSTRTEIIWFGHFSDETRTVTALGNWLKHKEPGFEPSWQPLSTTTYFVLGRLYGDMAAPAIYELNPIIDCVVESLTDDQIAGLVAVLRHGSREEQRRVIRETADEFFAKVGPPDVRPLKRSLPATNNPK